MYNTFCKIEIASLQERSQHFCALTTKLSVHYFRISGFLVFRFSGKRRRLSCISDLFYITSPTIGYEGQLSQAGNDWINKRWGLERWTLQALFLFAARNASAENLHALYVFPFF